MSLNKQNDAILGYYSKEKSFVFLLCAVALTVVPLMPGFSSGLHFTNFLYHGYGLLFLGVASLIMLILSLYLFVIVYRSMTGKPAIIIDQRSIVLSTITTKIIRISEISNWSYNQASITFQLPAGGFSFPMILVKDQDKVMNAIQKRLSK